MLKLTLNNREVTILSESSRTVRVAFVGGEWFNSRGDEVQEIAVLSKKYHKGALKLNGCSVI